MSTQEAIGSGRKILATVWACGVCMAPLFAGAADPAPDARVIGITDGLMAYCAKVAPSTSARLEAKIEQLTRGATEQQLQDLRKSDDYRQAYDSVTDFVSKVDPHNAARPCNEALAASEGSAP